MDLDALLQSHGEEAPSGEDLEYDPAFTELTIAATHGEERQAGDTILPGADPDYKDVTEKALAVLQHSHDLRAGIFLAEAQLALNGLPGFAGAMAYLCGCLERFWDSCHPQLDEEDDDDPTMRVNAVLSLADTHRILRGLRRAPLTDSRMFGRISLREIAVAEGETPPPADMDRVPDTATISAAFQDTDAAQLETFAKAAAEALKDAQTIVAIFDDKTPGEGPDLDPLIKLLKKINTRFATMVDAGATTETAAPEGAPTPSQTAAVPGLGGPSLAGPGLGAITSSADVTAALDRIMAYYERSEPSSPVPLLLARAKKLVNADFLTIVKNMAPDGVDNVNLIGGLEDDDDED